MSKLSLHDSIESHLPLPCSYSEGEKDQLKISICLYWQELLPMLSLLLTLVWHLCFVQPHFEQPHSEELHESFSMYLCARLQSQLMNISKAECKRDLLDSKIASYTNKWDFCLRKEAINWFFFFFLVWKFIRMVLSANVFLYPCVLQQPMTQQITVLILQATPSFQALCHYDPC